ncbi:MAG: hypothetical protein QXS76_03485 [Candidatus Bathyarchaeia archaeon]
MPWRRKFSLPGIFHEVRESGLWTDLHYDSTVLLLALAIFPYALYLMGILSLPERMLSPSPFLDIFAFSIVLFTIHDLSGLYNVYVTYTLYENFK